MAFDRMRRLVADEDVSNTVKRRSLPLEGWQQGSRPEAVRPDRVPLQRLDVVDVAARYPSAERPSGRSRSPPSGAASP